MEADVTVRVTVRFFAAARAAAGTETEMIDLRPGTTIAESIDALKARDPDCRKCWPVLVSVRRNGGTGYGDRLDRRADHGRAPPVRRRVIVIYVT